MKFRRQKKDDISVNLTPLIDVVFLLLIFFMVSTTFIKENQLSISLPQATGEVSKRYDNQIEVSIDKTGLRAINGKIIQENTNEELKKLLLLTAKYDTDTPLIITADATTPHKSVVSVMEAASAAGFKKLRITTRTAATQ